ncbi:hypothetical protein A4H97_03120 [Niastella yeongjuensis]|uniref:Uncharacterized protein n=1 Tax=Niastella yeongjuensis TaxID=354355 RepID=A0A1V9EXJ2_9BACT|nr:hypothetical protein [Niastella yeongjuensis]OQP50831.1 hypothetical protein A4H97_03120 [Niastella yeongjuensis]SEN15649.1 hypothetical protein SAMN05660816_00317 [Niastella yeongjuensis]
MVVLFKTLLLSVSIFFCFSVNAQHLKVAYRAPWGITQLKYDDQELINIDKGVGLGIIVESFKFLENNKVEKDAWSYPISTSWNDATKEFTATVYWGTVVCRYQQVGDTLFMKVTLTNNIYDMFRGVSLSLLMLNIGKRPSNFQPSMPYYNNNIAGPAVVAANTDKYKLVVENIDVSKKVYAGLLEGSGSNGTIYRIWTGTAPFNGMGDFDPRVELRLGPKESFSYTIAARFCKVNTPVNVAAARSYEAFRENTPFRVAWKDKRPIGGLFLASYTGKVNTSNLRNWILLSGANNATSEAGKNELRKAALDYADKSIGYLKKMNAQGMITWDIEGQQFPHPFSYIGSPELTAKLAPEMEGIADEYFDKFRKAGFKTGICIRPDSVTFSGNWINHVPVKDPAATLIRKIAYARKRWGCTIFYIDSNVDPNGNPMAYDYFKEVRDKFPDVLLIPEHETGSYYRYTAPYEETRQGAMLVSEEVKALYPEAFMTLYVPDGISNDDESVKKLAASIKQGNILIFRAWFNDDPTNSIIQKAMKMSGTIK